MKKLTSRYSLIVYAAVMAVLLGYAYLSAVDLKLGVGFLGAGIMFLWFWYDIRIGLWVLLFSVLLGQIVRFEIGGGGMLVSDGVMGVLIVVWIINVLVRKRVFKFNLLWLSLIGLWVTSGLINVWMSQNYAGDQVVTIWLYWVRFVMYSLCLPITWSVVSWYQETKRYFWWFMLVGILFLGLGLVQLKLVPDISFLTNFGWDPHQGRLLSTFLDPNFAGALLVLFFAISYAKYFQFKSWRAEKLFWAVLSGIFIIGVVLTLSRSALVAAGFVFLWLSFWYDKRLLLLGLCVGVLTLVNNPRLSERVVGILDIDETAMLRWESWQDSLEIVQDNFWLGIGYNALSFEQLRRGIIEDLSVHSAGGSDSSYLTVWSTMGWIGLLVYTWVLAIFVSLSSCIYGRLKDRGDKFLVLGVVLGIVGILIHAQFTNSLFYVHILILVWFLMGLVMGTVSKKGVLC
ncbi:O-antigen ligase family protein [Patescibacteria group bacterium]|nr:O-antigen ligase family protein [Patescibacteria group bacterium]